MTQPLEILPTGAWTDPDERNHKFDAGLAEALVEFFSTKDGMIIDLGCGPGRYVQAIETAERCNSKQLEIIGFDGNPNLSFVSEYCQWGDITGVGCWMIVDCDWILLLEVGEHIPAKYEPAIWNHLKRARQGVILSWATPGQGGHGHFNCREPVYIGQKMDELGFIENDATRLREASTLEWFRRNLRIFTRC